MLVFRVLELTEEKKLPLRNQLEILLYIYLVEKPNTLFEVITTAIPPLAEDHYLYCFLDVILKYIILFTTSKPYSLIRLYLNYDAQIFALPIVRGFFTMLSRLVLYSVI
jgi:hypothetical protein